VSITNVEVKFAFVAKPICNTSYTCKYIYTSRYSYLGIALNIALAPIPSTCEASIAIHHHERLIGVPIMRRDMLFSYDTCCCNGSKYLLVDVWRLRRRRSAACT
jgi:hypothetical protein